MSNLKSTLRDHKYCAVFFDDLKENFEDKHLCSCVYIYRSPSGIKKKPSEYNTCETMTGMDDYYRGAGVPTKDLKACKDILNDKKYSHIRKFIFDWDQTTTTWGGLPMQLNSKNCPMWKETIFGGKERYEALVDVFRHTKRVHILTSQEAPLAIKVMLNLMGVPHVPVTAYQCRNGSSKFEFIQRELLGLSVCKK